MRYKIGKVDGFPSLVLENGQNFGPVIRWARDGDGIAVTAGNIKHTVVLTKNNSDLEVVRADLNSLLS